MKNRYFFIWLMLICPVILSMVSCKEKEPVPQPTVDEILSVEIDQEQAGPQIVKVSPIDGERLALSLPIQIDFDREMDTGSTGEAWTFRDSHNEPISGKTKWADAETFTFQPDEALEPSSMYTGTFSTRATARDGSTLKNEIILEFKTAETLAVSQVFPTNDAGDIDGTTSVTVVFNRPVAPLLIEDEREDLPQPVVFSPEVSGQGEWLNSSVYVFQPAEPLPGGKRYEVRVEAGLEDISKNVLEFPFSWHFSTRAPVINRVALKNSISNLGKETDNVLLDQEFEVYYSQPMDQDSQVQAVSIVDRESGKPFPIRQKWNDDFTMLTVEPVGRYKPGGFYQFIIADSTQAQDGSTLQKGRTIKFSTVPPPRITSVSPDPDSESDDFQAWINIDFASPMNFDSVKAKVQISPEPEDGLELYYSNSRWRLTIHGLEPATEYLVRLLPGMADIYGNTIKDEYSFSFSTNDMRPYARLVLPWTPLVYRAKGKQDVFFEHINLEGGTVSLYELRYAEFSEILGEDKKAVQFKTKREPVTSWDVDSTDTPNALQHENFVLEDAGGNPLKPGYYLIGVQSDSLKHKNIFYQSALLIVATDNITFKATASEALAWVTDLESGDPKSDLPVIFYDSDFKEIGWGLTDQDGLLYMDEFEMPAYARVAGNDRLAFTALDWGSGVSAGSFGISQRYYGNTITNFAYLYSDRPLYRPTQEVQFKGIVRQNDDLSYSLPSWSKVHVTIEQAGETVYAKYLPLSEQGSFSGTFKIAEQAALGTYNITVRQQPGDEYPFGNLTFRVAEYHKPEFRVSSTAVENNVLEGEPVTFTLDATYYSGGNVVNGEVDWYLETSPFYFEPSRKFQQYSFTDWDRDTYLTVHRSDSSDRLVEGQGMTDENGHLEVRPSLISSRDKNSQQLFFHANVSDIAGNLVSGSTGVTVHQSEFYAGIKSEGYIGKQGEAKEFEVIVLDWHSNPVPGQNVTVQFIERRWFSVQEQDSQGTLRWVTSVKETPVSKTTVTTGEDGLVSASFTPPGGGVYKAVAMVRDSKGNTHQSSTYVWIAGKDFVPWRQTNDRSFQLVSDKDSYSPGETAELLIAQPFEGEVHALVTYERGHIYMQDVVLLKGNSTVYKLPISEAMAPVAYVSVIAISGAEVTDAPKFKIGMTRINVDVDQQTLNVSVAVDKEIAGPGDEVTYLIKTKDQAGKPVSADVSLAVIDKAALALAPSNSSPIVSAFYPERVLSVRTSLGIVVNADEFNADYRKTIPDGLASGGGGGGISLGVISVRQEFKDTAFFRAQLITDKEGQAEVSVRLPENLTTWVADVRAATEDSRIGQAASELISTKPLFVELTTPRFFVAGDQATIGARIHNNEEKELDVRVALEVEGVDMLSPQEKSIKVPAKQQAFLTWDVSVQQDASRVDLTAHAISDSFKDSSKPALGTLPGQGIPVHHYTVIETVGTAGMIQNANSKTEGIMLPTTLTYREAALSIEVAPSLVASMTEGLTYLKDFPHLCLEQTISRFLPNVIISRTLQGAGISSISEQSELDTQVNSALQRIYAKQHSDGGWAWWGAADSDPYTSAYVVYGLLEAQESGYKVSNSAIDKGIKYIKGSLPDLKRDRSTWKLNRRAFLLYVLAHAGELKGGGTNDLYEERSQLSLYGKAYLAQAIHLLDPDDARIDPLMSDLRNALATSSTGAHWDESDSDYRNWNTDTRTTSIVLNAFVQIEPENPLNANVVRWLMSQRESGYWNSTQETTWSLIALTGWLTTTKEYDSDYAYAIGLNGDLLLEAAASKDNLTETLNLQVDLEDMLKDEVNYLVFTRGSGTGNLYYSAYLKTELDVESVQPLDKGISISRQYYRLDDLKNPIDKIEQGELVRVRLTMVVPDSLHYVVIEDPLPAGLEPIDASLITDAHVPTYYSRQTYEEHGWGWWFFDHIELRDEKAVLSADYLPAGTYVYTYMARANTPGTFKVIPTTAAEFYYPDVGGRGAGSLFTVTP